MDSVKKHELVHKLKSFVQTGDVLFKLSNAKGPLGIPFSWLVAKLSKSKYSHAAIAIVENDEIFVVDIGQDGTILYRMIDWLDYCINDDFSIYRYNQPTPELIGKIREQIFEFLDKDPDYDFTFSSPDKFYCVESVVYIYEQVGIKLIEPQLLADIVGYWLAEVIKPFNYLVKTIFKEGFDFNVPVYYVGNENKGLMSSDKLTFIFNPLH